MIKHLPYHGQGTWVCASLNLPGNLLVQMMTRREEQSMKHLKRKVENITIRMGTTVAESRVYCASVSSANRCC